MRPPPARPAPDQGDRARRDVRLTVPRFGGTGMDSASLVHTREYPLRLEAGTLNLLGVLGLAEGLAWVGPQVVEVIHPREAALLVRLRDGLAAHPGVTLCAADGDLADRVAVLLATVEGIHPQDVGAMLDGDFGIAVRVGVHCAPLAQRDLGTIDRGAARFSLGAFTTADEIDQASEAMRSQVAE